MKESKYEYVVTFADPDGCYGFSPWICETLEEAKGRKKWLEEKGYKDHGLDLKIIKRLIKK